MFVDLTIEASGTPKASSIIYTHAEAGKVTETLLALRETMPSAKLLRVEWPSYAWPGGYPLYYVTQDGGCLCPKCANDNFDRTRDDDPQWHVVAQEVNYEVDDLFCDNCGDDIGPAYLTKPAAT